MTVKLVLNEARTVTVDVPVPQGEETAIVKAVCKIINRKELQDKTLELKDVLVSVSNIEVAKADGTRMDEQELLDFVINDDMLSALTLQAYNLGNQNTLMKSKTYIQQSKQS